MGNLECPLPAILSALLVYSECEHNINLQNFSLAKLFAGQLGRAI